MEDSATEETAETKERPASAAPFNQAFFATVFPDRLRLLCRKPAEDIPVVLLQLADHRELDLCHIEVLAPQWMGAAAFRDAKSCDDMDVVFVPYDLITGITVRRSSPEARRMGFQADRPVTLATSPEGA